jgi:hypothetical protein
MRFMRLGIAAAMLTAAWLLAYGPTVPGGFVKDDFGWIVQGRLHSWTSVLDMFGHAADFYRPIVRLSFGATEALFGDNPVPYALTNLALGLGCAGALYALSRALGLPSWAALLAAAAWAFNFHGINMAVVWLSGRTSLLGTLFALLSALALARDRRIASGLLVLAALLSKEEVAALPLVLTAWLAIDRRDLRASLPAWVALAVYAVLRQQSGAFFVSDAPVFYQFTFVPGHLADNLLEYADRSMTFSALVAVVGAIALGRLPRLNDGERRVALKGAAWLLGGFAVTLWLPVRSSLYAVLPSAGAALAAAAFASAMVRDSEPARARRVAAVALVLPFLLLPVYWSRNVRWTELRDLSNATIRAIQAGGLADGTLVVLEDDLSTRANFRHTFGGAFPEAALLCFYGRLRIWIEPPPPEAEGSQKPAAPNGTVTFRLVGGRVVP